jgi:hypothetical protein
MIPSSTATFVRTVIGSLVIVGTTLSQRREYRAKGSGKSGCFSHAIIESEFIARIYSSPPSPGALKKSWLLLIRTMEPALGMQSSFYIVLAIHFISAKNSKPQTRFGAVDVAR